MYLNFRLSLEIGFVYLNVNAFLNVRKVGINFFVI